MPDAIPLLRLMVEREASDLFLTADTVPHLKIDGVVVPVDMPPLKPGDSRLMIFDLMNEQQRGAFETAKEANLALVCGEVGRFRMNVYYQRGEVSAVIRLIRARIPDFNELGVPSQGAALCLLKRGLVLIVGAPGSGKSTSMAAMVNYRAQQRDGHILTIEDPIEFLFPHGRAIVEQREVGLDTLSFGDALRNAMREAPDVIVIGEIRDRETAQHALMYAEAGALCLSTMHSNNANQAIDRFINFFPEDMHPQLRLELSLNLKGVLSQRLIPGIEKQQVLASEILLQSAYASDLIRKGQIDLLKDAMKKGSEVGMQLFDDCLYQLYRNRQITLDQALLHADSRTDLGFRIKLS